MAKQTRREQVVEELQAAGYRYGATNSTKYVKMTKGADTLWIGKNGAVRCGKSISDSFSISGAFWGKTA